jgi:branched-chain amino acid transport system permease protein
MGVLMMLTFGISIVVKAAAVLIWGTGLKSFPAFTGDEPIYLGHAYLKPQALWILGACLSVAAALYIFFMRTVPGKAFRACAINQVMARIVGCNPAKQSLIAFVMAAALGGLAGIFITPLVPTSYNVGLNLTIGGFMAAVIGGMNRVEGVLLGGFGIGLVEAMAAGWIPGGSGYKDAVALGVFLVVLYFRRHGLMGAEE